MLSPHLPHNAKRFAAFVTALVIFGAAASAFLYVRARAATTYTWSGSGSWATAANWTPTRTTPAAADVLVFNGGGTFTVTGVPTETLGQLQVSNNTAVTLQPAATGTTLTVGGGAGALSVASGSQLNVSGANTLNIGLPAGSSGAIGGSMTYANAAHKLTAADASAVTFQSGSTFTAGTGFSGNPFGTTSLNSVVFAGGSKYVYVAGGNPFGATAPSSVVVFQAGSTYSHQSNSLPSLSGRTYANFELASGAVSPVGGSAVSIDNLSVLGGTLNWGMTGTPGHSIKGSISVSAGATLNFSPSSAGTVNLDGSSAQTVTNAGTLTFGANQTVNVNNASGVTLASPVSMNAGTLALTGGAVTTGANVLSIGSAAGVTRANGHVVGNLRKTFAAAGPKTFEVGTANGYSPVAVNATAGTFPAELTVSATQGKLPQISGANALARYWTLGGSGVTADLTFHYLAGDVTGAESDYRIFKYGGGGFTRFAPDALDTANHTATLNGVSSFSDWTLAETASVPPPTVYVDDDWAGATAGTDPDGAGPATDFGYDAFATVQGGVGGAAAGGTVNVYEGVYYEDVNVNKVGLTVTGFGTGIKDVIGVIGGDGATFRITASNVTVADFTVMRQGNNTTDWNDPGLNSAAFAIQGLAVTGAVIRDNLINANRTGIDINNSGGHTIRNNVISFNRTGVIFRNQTDQITFVENFVVNNWTVGVLFLDGSGGTNSPVQSAAHSTFSNNSLFANWYGHVVDRQTGGSLPAPGTTNLKNFRGNWWGTVSPVVTTANSAEPGYAAQIPVPFGGTATPPGGQPDIAGPASANIKYLPLLTSDEDTDVETTPGRGTYAFQGVPNTVVVSPANQQGWVFFDDLPGTGTGSGGFEEGPATPPLGAGSAFLTVDGQGRHALGTPGYAGTRMDDIAGLSYYSYQDNNANTVVAPSLQFDIDYDLNDANNAFMGRLVFEPYLTPAQGAIQQNAWQNWDARAGNWYGTRTTVTAGNTAGISQPCQPATPCTWQQVVTLFPNAGVRNTATSLVLFKAGGPWAPGFDGNVDDFRIAVNAAEIAYDFEAPPRVSINDVSQAEGDAGQTDFTFDVTLSRAAAETVTVDYATADSTATAGSDYTAAATTQLIFNPGETSKQVTVEVNGDTAFEPDEIFFVNLSNPRSNAALGDAQGEGTIENDDPEISFSVDDVTQAEGDAGQTAFTFNVTRTGAGAASVDFATQDGTAEAGSDYASNSGTLNFAPGETTKQVTVLVNGDTTPEVDETFDVRLSNPSAGAGIGDDTGTGTIRNDEESVSAGQLIISEFRLRGPGLSLPPESLAKSPAKSSAKGAAKSSAKPGAASAPCGGSRSRASAATGSRRKARAYVLGSSPAAEPDTSPEANDEFIELYNNTDTPLLVTTTDGSEGWAVAASDGVVRFIIPVGTVIPPRAHFLSPNLLGYSLYLYPAGDGSFQPPFALGDYVIRGDGTDCFGYELDIPDNAGIALFRTSDTASFDMARRLDAAGSNAEANALYREGAGYPALAAEDISKNLEHSFYRSLCSFVGGTGCTTPGVPKDTGDNASDFLFVDTKGTQTAAGRRLGAPGPENLASNVQRNGQFSFVPIDRTVATSAPPNRVRTFAEDMPNNSTFGTLSVRRRVTNHTGEPVTSLRFRIVELTTHPAPAGTADLRARDSADVVVTGVGDTGTCEGSAPCDVNVLGTTLEQPPGQPHGGGLNSTLAVGTITLDSPLADGQSVSVQFLLGIQQTGTFRFLVNIEAVTDSCSCPAAAAPGRNAAPPR